MKLTSDFNSWEDTINHYLSFLQLEKGLSEHSIVAYAEDVKKLKVFCEQLHITSPKDVNDTHIQEFLTRVHELGLTANSQARILSGIKSYFSYLVLEQIVETNPTTLIESPRIPRKLPDILSISEIEQLIQSIDHSAPEGTRNRAIIETLYGCGLRVSELTHLELSNIHWREEIIKVTGKNNKERIIPINREALKWISLYVEQDRKRLNIQKNARDIVFLNRRGKPLSRVMILIIVKNLATLSSLQKTISPHTFRHSFATHLVEGGADLRAVQDLLGHESITTTEIYTHLDQRFLRDTIIHFHPRSKVKS